MFARVTVIEGPRTSVGDCFSTLGDSFYWGVTTVVGSGDASYVSSPGGYVIIDDYSIPACREAVADFRAAQKITDPIEEIDWTGVFWRRMNK